MGDAPRPSAVDSEAAAHRDPTGGAVALRALAAAGALLPLVPGYPPALALTSGVAVGLAWGNPWPAHTPRLVKQGLAVCVVGLGFGVDLGVVARVGVQGLGATAIGIVASLGVGVLLARVLRVERVLALLIASGTAICGGSAIAAVAPVLGARDEDIGVAVGVVFLLNAVALVVFPPLGHLLQMPPDEFGRWAALAIHDTSSVVGAAATYGGDALAVATPTKLARALWIVPLSAGLALVERRGRGAALPWFIPAFLLAAALAGFVPGAAAPGRLVAATARQVLGAVLFLTGLGITRATLRRVSLGPLGLAVLLWGFVAAVGWCAV